MNSRWARVARGGAAASFATFVACLSHTFAGGPTPSVFGVVASLVLSLAICTLLTGRSLSTWRLAIAIALSQAMFHGLFSTLGTPIPVKHVHSAVQGALDATGGMHHSPTMWLAHAAAGLITLVAFRHAEAAFWGVRDTALLLLGRLFSLPAPVPAWSLPSLPMVIVTPPLADRVFLTSLLRRGPPMELVAR
ncbi:MAG: hypothetical protein ABJA94_07490 [Rhodoglobus sp.]